METFGGNRRAHGPLNFPGPGGDPPPAACRQPFFPFPLQKHSRSSSRSDGAFQGSFFPTA